MSLGFSTPFLVRRRGLILPPPGTNRNEAPRHSVLGADPRASIRTASINELRAGVIIHILLAITIAAAMALITGGCGHYQSSYGDIGPAAGESPSDDAGYGDSEGESGGESDEAGSDGGSECRGFALSVASVEYGPGAGFGQARFPEVVLGPPVGKGASLGGTDVLSMGEGGEIVLDLGDCHAVDGPGPDFVVFENAFFVGGNPENPYAEPGIVGVSLDGTSFFDYPCAAEAYPFYGCAGRLPVYSNPQNGIDPFDPEVAGGEAYDLGESGLASARFIRIRDAGNGGAPGTAGFDLDAVAAINGETSE